ncbi:MAG: TolB family protein, partial [Gemmatimonadales bacterium]
VQVVDAEQLNTGPQWAPDGRHLYWVSGRGGGRDVYRVRVRRGGKPGGDPVRITTGAFAHTLTLSADGSRLAYASVRTQSNIWSMPVPASAPASGEWGRGARPVTSESQTVEGVDVSPDGAWLVFDSDRNGNSDIYKVPVRGGEPIQLTTDTAGDYSPAWSPDGRRIAFHSLRNGTRDVFTMEANGSGQVERVSGPAQELDPDWSPDGKALAVEVIPADAGLGTYFGFFRIAPLDAAQEPEAVLHPRGPGYRRPSPLAGRLRRPRAPAYPVRIHYRRAHVLLHDGVPRERSLGRGAGPAVRTTLNIDDALPAEVARLAAAAARLGIRHAA